MSQWYLGPDLLCRVACPGQLSTKEMNIEGTIPQRLAGRARYYESREAGSAI